MCLKPLIGIAGRPKEDTEEQNFFVHAAQFEDVQAVYRNGGMPVILPPVFQADEAADWVARLNGVYIPGGWDVSLRYNPSADPALLEHPDEALDEADAALIGAALETGKPLLCICRGMQVLNVALGGILADDIPTRFTQPLAHRPAKGAPPDSSAHRVELAAGSLLSGIFNAPYLRVNSFHHQAVLQVGESLFVTARAPDGMIEGLEHRDHPFCLAVQWHPEVAIGNQEGMDALFIRFIQAAGA